MISHYYFPSLSHCTYSCHNIMNQTWLTIQYLSYATPVVLQPVPIQAMPTEIPNKAYAQKAVVSKPTAILLSARPPRKHWCVKLQNSLSYITTNARPRWRMRKDLSKRMRGFGWFWKVLRYPGHMSIRLMSCRWDLEFCACANDF